MKITQSFHDIHTADDLWPDKWIDRRRLARRWGSTSYVPVEGFLIVGPNVMVWHERYDIGYDMCRLRPALHNGDRCWLVTRRWVPAPGYSAEGTESFIYDYKEGLALLRELEAHGIKLVADPWELWQQYEQSQRFAPVMEPPEFWPTHRAGN